MLEDVVSPCGTPFVVGNSGVSSQILILALAYICVRISTCVLSIPWLVRASVIHGIERTLEINESQNYGYIIFFSNSH